MDLGGIRNEPGAILVTSNINSEAPSNLKFYNNTINGGLSGIKLYGLGLHTGEDIIIENNKIYNTTKGIYVLGNDNNCYSELIIESNILLDNEYSIYSTETYKIKIGNNTISGIQGVYIGDSASAFIHYNFITSQNYGLVFNSTEAVVSFNDIISTCFQESCLEIGFTKIGIAGISASTNSNIKIMNNNISKYDRIVDIANSAFESENNKLESESNPFDKTTNLNLDKLLTKANFEIVLAGIASKVISEKSKFNSQISSEIVPLKSL